MFTFDRRNVTGVDLDVDGSKMTLEAEEGDKWRIAKPGPYRGDADFLYVDTVTAASYGIGPGPRSWREVAGEVERLRAAYAQAGFSFPLQNWISPRPWLGGTGRYSAI